MDYDSTNDTKAHIQRVAHLLEQMRSRLLERAQKHDQSKLQEPEKSTFDYATPRLKGSTYGSEEYRGFLSELKPALDHHYAANSHHPEHYPWRCACCDRSFSNEQAPESERTAGVDGETHRFCPECCKGGSVIWEAELLYDPTRGVYGMTLMDLVEMFCDWKAATERHADGSLEKSIQINRERFHLTRPLTDILENTRKELNW